MICVCHFFFNDTSISDIYPLSLHDALPIFREAAYMNMQKAQHLKKQLEKNSISVSFTGPFFNEFVININQPIDQVKKLLLEDRKSTRLNSSHVAISYAVFCLKKKTKDRSKL